jgi:hypothetical protein
MKAGKLAVKVPTLNEPASSFKAVRGYTEVLIVL